MVQLQPILEVSFLWAPLTEGVKCAALAEKGAPERQWFADLAREFIDDKLGDVVLYAGKYRDQIMRPSVQAALCYLIHGTPIHNGKTCENGDLMEPTIISHSLGGYMLMDAIDEELRDQSNGAPNPNSAAYLKIVQNTQLIYMMANQLTLLDLTTLDKYPNIQARTYIRAATQPAPLGRWRKDLSGTGRKSGLNSRHCVVVGERQHDGSDSTDCGLRDPNDILSWLVKPNNLALPEEQWNTIKLSNVYMPNNEFSIPGVFSNPVTAHTGYFNNMTVLELLVCGMSNGSVVD